MHCPRFCGSVNNYNIQSVCTVLVVVELPQTPEDDLSSTRAMLGMQQVSHSWCMCVVSHGYCGWMGLRMEVVDGMHAGQNPGSHVTWSYAGRCRSTSQVQGETLMTPDHSFQVRSSG